MKFSLRYGRDSNTFFVWQCEYRIWWWVINSWAKREKKINYWRCFTLFSLCVIPYCTFWRAWRWKEKRAREFEWTRKNHCWCHHFIAYYPIWDTGLLYSCLEFHWSFLWWWTWCNISNTRDSASSGYPNTEKRVENMTCSRVFLTLYYRLRNF